MGGRQKTGPEDAGFRAKLSAADKTFARCVERIAGRGFRGPEYITAQAHFREHGGSEEVPGVGEAAGDDVKRQVEDVGGAREREAHGAADAFEDGNRGDISSGSGVGDGVRGPLRRIFGERGVQYGIVRFFGHANDSRGGGK